MSTVSHGPGWIAHALLPLGAWGALVALAHAAGLDAAFGDWLYDHQGQGWPLASGGWAYLIFYRGGRGLVMSVVLLAVLTVLASFYRPALRRWRRPTSYLLVCIVLTTGLVSLGKHATNVDCPRALARYGGDRPQVGLLADRPDDLPRAQCFPAGHSSGGFSFLALYFLLGERRRRWRWPGLAAGFTLGLSFAAVQWGRGMHFPSHDLSSAAIAWAVALGAYTVLYRSSVWNSLGSGRDAPAAD